MVCLIKVRSRDFLRETSRFYCISEALRGLTFQNFKKHAEMGCGGSIQTTLINTADVFNVMHISLSILDLVLVQNFLFVLDILSSTTL
jgi:hypothetical protein